MNIERVLIEQDGFYGVDEDDRRVSLADRTLSFLNEPVAIAAGVTLGDLLRAVSADELLTGFVGAYAHCTAIDEFHAEAARPFAPEPGSALVALEVSRHVRLHWHAFDFSDDERSVRDGDGVWRIVKVPKAVPYYELHGHCDFSGIDETGRPYAIEFTPLDQLSGLPLRLQEEAAVTVDEQESADVRSTTYRARTTFSLLELLEAIYYEISFCGTPAKRDAELGQIKASYDEVLAEPEIAGRRIEIEFVDA